MSKKNHRALQEKVMHATEVGGRLIAELLANPHKFHKLGQASALLHQYFEGFPVETLRPLLASDDEFVQASAAYIASELGREARSLVDDVIPLLHSPYHEIVWHAMDVLIVCCKGEHAEKLAHLARMLEVDEQSYRLQAMFLMANASVGALEAALRVFESPDTCHETHARGFRMLIGKDQIEPAVISAIRAPDPLLRRYGAIAAKRCFGEFPNLIVETASSDDDDLINSTKGILRL